MSDTENAVGFFRAGVSELAPLSDQVRAALWKICLRQMTLSSSIAVDTLHRAPELAAAVKDPAQLQKVFEVASDIAHRSAKHSAEFLRVTPSVFTALARFEGSPMPVADLALKLAGAFSARAGGIATDAWTELPKVLAGLSAEAVALLFAEVENFLERGGSVALHVMVAGAATDVVVTGSLSPNLVQDWPIRAAQSHIKTDESHR